MLRAPTVESTARDAAPPQRFSHTVRRYGLVALCYVLTTAVTGAFFLGDTVDYADSVVTGRDFWDFGHLLWRPLGRVFFKLLGPLVHSLTGASDRNTVILILLALNWVAGLGCCLLLCATIRRRTRRDSVAAITLATLLWSQSFLNHAHTGNAYVCGLALLTLGLLLRLTWPTSPKLALCAGLALAGAVLVWLQFLWAVPAILAAPLFLAPYDPAHRGAAARATAAFAGSTLLAYSAVIIGLHLTHPAALLEWIKASSHGILPSPSVARTVFGFARSFINMGDDAILFKRFLVHDPVNPVTLAQLFRVSLWKLLLFYGFLLSLIAVLSRTAKDRRMLTLLALNAAPVLAFAALWQGSDMERYLPLYPVLCLALATALTAPTPRRWLEVIAAIFVVVLMISNLAALATPTLRRQQAVSASRLAPLEPLLKPHSIEVAVSPNDDIIAFNRSFPLHPLNRDNRYHLRVLLEFGTSQVGHWRQSFATSVLTTWREGGDVWITKRVLSRRPRAEWKWVEGGEQGVSWHDIFGLFGQLDLGETVGGDDGFVLLRDTPRNRAALRREAWMSAPSG